MVAINALIIVDMQEDYVGINRNKKTYPYNVESLISNVNIKIEQCQQNNDLIIYIKNVAKGKKSGFVKGLHIVSELIYEKYKASCFSSDELRLFLSEKNITNIELVGVDGNYCAGLSALEGVKLGFSVKLTLECIGVSKYERFEEMKKRLFNAGAVINLAV